MKNQNIKSNIFMYCKATQIMTLLNLKKTLYFTAYEIIVLDNNLNENIPFHTLFHFKFLFFQHQTKSMKLLFNILTFRMHFLLLFHHPPPLLFSPPQPLPAKISIDTHKCYKRFVIIKFLLK